MLVVLKRYYQDDGDTGVTLLDVPHDWTSIDLVAAFQRVLETLRGDDGFRETLVAEGDMSWGDLMRDGSEAVTAALAAEGIREVNYAFFVQVLQEERVIREEESGDITIATLNLLGNGLDVETQMPDAVATDDPNWT